MNLLGLLCAITGITGGLYTLAYAGNHKVTASGTPLERLLYNNPHMAYELRRIARVAHRHVGTGRALRFRTTARLLRHDIRRRATATLVATLLTVAGALTLVAGPPTGRGPVRPVATVVRTRT